MSRIDRVHIPDGRRAGRPPGCRRRAGQGSFSNQLSDMVDRINVPLVSTYTGTSRKIAAFRLGTPGARPRAYLQAALHAEELNGTLVIHRLQRRLTRLEVEGRLTGEIILVPLANPIGLSQHACGRHLGRFHLESRENFNRNFADLAADLAAKRAELAALDPVRRRDMIVDRLVADLKARIPDDELADLRLRLLELAFGADVVLDLHCEERGPLHLYLSSPAWPGGHALAAFLHAAAVILNRVNPADLSFSEANAHPWLEATRLGLLPPTALPTVATVELRGRGDMTDTVAETDADRLIAYLQHAGVVAGGPLPVPPLHCDPTPLEAMDVGYAPAPGIVTFRQQPGERVAVGDPIATLLDPMTGDEHRMAARGAGVLFAARTDGSFLAGGAVVYRIAGQQALAHRCGKGSVDD